jgi:hypothetical protein
MVRLQSLPENANVYEVFASNPAVSALARKSTKAAYKVTDADFAAAGPRIRDQGYSGSLTKFSGEKSKS